MNETLRVIKLTTDSAEGIIRKWYEISGECPHTGCTFKNEVFALTADDRVLDSDGCPMEEGDRQALALRRSIRG